MSKTIFQKIIDREIPSQIVHEDEHCAAFRDVSPKAPTHVLIVPRKPIPSIDAIAAEDAATIGHIWLMIPKIARELGLVDGYRVVVNCGRDGGQSVDHLHFHILGGRALGWPPG